MPQQFLHRGELLPLCLLRNVLDDLLIVIGPLLLSESGIFRVHVVGLSC